MRASLSRVGVTLNLCVLVLVSCARVNKNVSQADSATNIVVAGDQAWFGGQVDSQSNGLPRAYAAGQVIIKNFNTGVVDTRCWVAGQPQGGRSFTFNTGPRGTYNLSIICEKVGLKTVEVTVPDTTPGVAAFQNIYLLQVIPAIPYKMTLTTQNATAAVGAAVSVTSQIWDRYDNPIPNVRVSLRSTPSAGITSLVCQNPTNTAGSTSCLVSASIAGDYVIEDSQPSTTDGAQLTVHFTSTVTPAIAIDDVTVVEGTGGTTDMTFTVSLAPSSANTVTVQYATQDDTAVAPTDYQADSNTLTFNPGEVSKPVVIHVAADNASEALERFFVNLSNPTGGAAITDAQGIGTITDDDVVPTVSIAAASQTEGGPATTAVLNMIVTLSAPASQIVTVNVSTANGTAIAPADYVAVVNGVIQFNPGEVSKPAAITINGDNIYETNETFTVTLSNPVNATLGSASAIATIVDDDPVPAASVNDVSVVEGGAGLGILARFNVTLSNPSAFTSSINIATANDTATAPSDYGAVNLLLTFAPGALTRSVFVPIVGDNVNEPDERFFVNLSNPVGMTIADGQGVGLIRNDDALPTIAINDPSVIEGNAGLKSLIFTVTLSPASSQTVTVDWSTADITAVSGLDYVAASGQVTFSPGQTSQPINVSVVGDLLNEANETFAVNLANATNATLADAQGVGTISDDDALPHVSINSPAATLEGDSGTLPLTFTISLDAPSGQTVSVQYATANGTALAGSDYVSATQVVTFTPGQLSQPVTIQIVGDVIAEAQENFTVTLSNLVNAQAGTLVGTGTINDNDAAPTVVVNDATAVTEGNSGTTTLSFMIGLTSVNSVNTTVTWTTSSVGATNAATGGAGPGAGVDYLNASGVVVIPAGQLTPASGPVQVTVYGDALNELDEHLFVVATSAVGAPIGDGQGEGVILNDDSAPSLSINDISVNENAGTATFTVSLSSVSGQNVTFDWATANGSALSPGDFSAGSGTQVTIAAGSLTYTIPVTINDDFLNEGAENFFVNISNAVNATISDAQGAGTIVDNDAAPTLSINDVSVNENAGTATFTVSLSSVSGQNVKFDWTTANGTAVAPGDYTAGSGTQVTIAAGSLTFPITVAVIDDAISEGPENFSINLSNPLNATLADAQGIATIIDNDGTPSLSINDVSVNEAAGIATFTVSLSSMSGQNVQFDWSTANGTAAAPFDYAAGSGTQVTIPAGSLTYSIPVSILNDSIYEMTENFFVNISNPVNATILDAQGVGTITDNEAVPVVSINSPSVNEGNSGTTVLSFTVSIPAVSGVDVLANWATSNGTATGGAAPGAGIDYLTASGLVTIPAGSLSAPVNVTVYGDTVFENNETLLVTLSNPVGATLGTFQGTGTIVNDDGLPLVSIADVSITEGNSGTQVMNFVATIPAPSAVPVTVNWATSDLTATAGSDYVAASGVATIPAGAVSSAPSDISVTINGDTSYEPDETFQVTLSNFQNSAAGDAVAVGTIVNDDAAPTPITISIQAGASVREWNAPTQTTVPLTLTLSQASSVPIVVNFRTLNGSATWTTGDYVNVPAGAITIPAGQTSWIINQVNAPTSYIRVVGDSVDEYNENFFVQVTGADSVPSGQQPVTVQTGADQSTVVILDDDPAFCDPSLFAGIDTAGYYLVGSTTDPALGANQFNNIRQCLDQRFRLIADIDLIYYPDWSPIGYIATPPGASTEGFRGEVDGQGHTIYNLSFILHDDTDVYYGLFGSIKRAGRVANLTLESPFADRNAGDPNGSVGYGAQYFGFVAGYIDGAGASKGQISNITINHPSVIIDGHHNSIDLGLFVGVNEGDIFDVTFNGNVGNFIGDDNIPGDGTAPEIDFSLVLGGWNPTNQSKIWAGDKRVAGVTSYNGRNNSSASIDGCQIHYLKLISRSYTAGVAVENHGSINDCHLDNLQMQIGVLPDWDNSGNYVTNSTVGGMVAYNLGNISNSSIDTFLFRGHNVAYFGGAAGIFEELTGATKTISNVQINGMNIYHVVDPNNGPSALYTDYSYIGGMVGWLRTGDARVTTSHAQMSFLRATGHGSSNATPSGNIGGFVGTMGAGTIDKSWADATITWTPLRYGCFDCGPWGGFVGNMGGASTIRESFARGSITASNGDLEPDPSHAGGIELTGGFVGAMGSTTAHIEDSYATTQVFGKISVGGFAGFVIGGSIARSHSVGAVNVHSGNASQFGVNGAYYGVWYRLGIGGFVGSNNVDQYNNDAWENRITDSYNLDSTWNYSGWVKYYMGNGNFSNWFFMTSGAGFNFRWCNWVNYDFTNATDECYQQWPNPPNYTGPDPVMSYAEAPVGGLTPVTRLSAGQMGNQVNYNNWNFSTIWQMGPNGYPTLRNILDPQ